MNGHTEDLHGLVVDLKGLVLVRRILRERGTNVDELDAGIVRARERLAQAIRPGAA